jgi:cell division protein FtsI/penicillin-binding protein 2
MRQITRPFSITQVWPASIAKDLKEAMTLAAREGTAQSNLGASLDYGGKTGTSQMAQGRDHAWFIGFAPTTKPEVVVAVLVEHGGSGSQVAVPIGTKVLITALGLDE